MGPEEKKKQYETDKILLFVNSFINFCYIFKHNTLSMTNLSHKKQLLEHIQIETVNKILQTVDNIATLKKSIDNVITCVNAF